VSARGEDFSLVKKFFAAAMLHIIENKDVTFVMRQKLNTVENP
jgi:hypothetical protein